MKKLKVLGITSGIGSLQYGFHQSGAAEFDNFFIKDNVIGYIRPLTIRKRARIQGFGNDFLFAPDKYKILTTDKTYRSLIKQTGKCMPVQFHREFSRQLANFLNDGIQEDFTPSRLLKQIDSINQLNLF